MDGNTAKTTRLTRLETSGQDGILHLVGQLLHAIDLLDRLFPTLDQFVELVIHGQPTGDKVVGLVLGDGESSLDGFLSGPVFSVGLSLDKDLRTQGSISECRPGMISLTSSNLRSYC